MLPIYFIWNAHSQFLHYLAIKLLLCLLAIILFHYLAIFPCCVRHGSIVRQASDGAGVVEERVDLLLVERQRGDAGRARPALILPAQVEAATDRRLFVVTRYHL